MAPVRVSHFTIPLVLVVSSCTKYYKSRLNPNIIPDALTLLIQRLSSFLKGTS